MAKPGRKPKKEIEQDIQQKKDEVFLKFEESYFNSINDVSIKKLIPNVFNRILITINDGHQTCYIPNNMTGFGYANWKDNTPGGIFSKDVNNYAIGKKPGNYIILNTDNEQIIARIIEDEEIEEFHSRKLIHGKTIDKAYMILKKIGKEEKLITTKIPRRKEKYESKEENIKFNKNDQNNENKSLINS